MSRKHLAALLIALATLSDPAAAELRGAPEGAPVFTATEVAVIARNAVLTTLVQDNPWAVRRLLDAMAAIETAAAAGNPAPSEPGKVGAGAGGLAPDANVALDPQTNPDLDQLQRTSPEAVLDLFKLLKQASPAKPQTPK